MSGNDDNKRESERVPLLGTLSGEVMVYQPMVIRQISHGGMEIETGFVLQLDSLHDFRLRMAGGRSVVIKGRVAHSHISDVDQDVIRYSSGIEFVEAPERVSAAIDEFIEMLQRAHSPRADQDLRIDSAD
jgi:hypothetical protein